MHLLRYILIISISLFLSNCGGGSTEISEGNHGGDSTEISEGNRGGDSTEISDGNTGGNNNENSGGNSGGGSGEDDTKLYGISLYAKPLNYSQYALAALSDSEFNALSTEKRYQVALKLYATFFYGTTYSQISESIESGTFISQTQEKFDQENDISDITAVEAQILNYQGWGDGKVMAPMLARLFHLPPGREYLNRWTAYILTQTILFSPAFELDTVYVTDASSVYHSLMKDFDDTLSLQWVTFKHMITNENWRRFRSPEDNGREMLEIFLMDFNDSHVPMAAKALQNWQLDRQTNTLVITPNENTEPITDLFKGTTVINGTDFYSTLVLQPNFLTTVSSRLVDIYFPNHTETQKTSIVRQLVSNQPTSWKGLLKQIVYSKEYLLNSQKTRTFEETFFPIAKTLGWHPHTYSFHLAYDLLNKMHQSTMSYKLGRKNEVPLDSQSFAWLHKTVREFVMINTEENTDFQSWDDGWSAKEIFRVLPQEANTKEKIAEHIVHTLFISIIGRDANSNETQFFKDMIDSSKYDSVTFRNFRGVSFIGNNDPEADLLQRGNYANIILDYLSRLSSTYTFDAVQ